MNKPEWKGGGSTYLIELVEVPRMTVSSGRFGNSSFLIRHLLADSSSHDMPLSSELIPRLGVVATEKGVPAENDVLGVHPVLGVGIRLIVEDILEVKVPPVGRKVDGGIAVASARR